MTLLIAWLIVDPKLWPLGLAAGILSCIGFGQMLEWIPPI
jgi:hypothetical protein